MKRKNALLLAIVAALVCALGICGLSACSGNGGSGGKSDDQIIEEQLAEYMDRNLSKDFFAEKTRADTDLAALEEHGFDIDKYAENYSKLFSYKITEVQVDGDKAIAKIEMTVPVFGEEFQALLTERTATLGLENIPDQQQALATFWNAYADLMADPSMPKATDTVEIAFVKTSGNWNFEDEQQFADDMQALMTAAQ